MWRNMPNFVPMAKFIYKKKKVTDDEFINIDVFKELMYL
jgi:hypothetical protein